MGSGASKKKSVQPKQENLRQPLSTQNKTDITRPNESSPPLLGNKSRKPLTPIQSPIKQNGKQSIHNSQVSIQSSGTLSVRTPSSQFQNQFSTVPNDTTSTQRIKILSNKPSVSSHQKNHNSDDNELQLVPINNIEKNSLSSNPVTPLPPVKSSSQLSGQSGHCSFCPHCKRLQQTMGNKSKEPQPVWITEPRSKIDQHIIMDNYDEEAVRRKIISEYGRLPGSYDYPPNLTIEEKKDHNEISKKYLRLPIIAKSESSMSPAHTPFPNYNILQRREKQLNKPYTSTLFTD